MSAAAVADINKYKFSVCVFFFCHLLLFYYGCNSGRYFYYFLALLHVNMKGEQKNEYVELPVVCYLLRATSFCCCCCWSWLSTARGGPHMAYLSCSSLLTLVFSLFFFF